MPVRIDGVLKTLGLAALSAALGACSTLKTREQVRESARRQSSPTIATSSQASPSAPASPGMVVSTPPTPDMTADEEANPVTAEESREEEAAPAPRNIPSIPKIGLILGPGGALAYAHIGVLHEMQREKVPIHAIAGLEWGAPVAALYSMKGLANEAEWQMMKLKSEDVLKKGFISSSPSMQPVTRLSDFLKMVFGNAKTESAKLPFVCPALNLSKNQTYLMSRGSFTQMLPFCLPYPPLFRSFQGNVAGLRDVKIVADQLRAVGADWIILVNLLPAPNPDRPLTGSAETAEALLWNELAVQYSKPLPGVDQVWSLDLEDGVTSFDRKREILQKGAERSVQQIRQTGRRFGL